MHPAKQHPTVFVFCHYRLLLQYRDLPASKINGTVEWNREVILPCARFIKGFKDLRPTDDEKRAKIIAVVEKRKDISHVVCCLLTT